MNYKRITDLPGVRIAREAMVVGDVTIGEDSCVLFYSTVRGDEGTITIGRETNIQEIVGDNVTIGHQAIIHGCTVGDRTLIGMAATILDGAEIGCDCIVGAGSLVTKHTRVPDGSLVLGSPAKVVRQLTEAEKKDIYRNSREYVKVAREMQEQGLLP